MSEDGEMWRAIHEDVKAKKRSNEKSSISLLIANNIPFKLLSADSSHYRVGDFDYWPTTGLFYNQKTKRKGRGVKKLIQIIKSKSI